MASKKIIYVITPPSTGHVNPICGVVNELCKHSNVEVIFYSDECYREAIQKTGAQFRAFSHPTFSRIALRPLTERKLSIGELLNTMITFSYDILPNLIADAERDQPDLILYDSAFIAAKFLIEVIKSREAKGTWNRTVPKTVGFIPNFPAAPQMVAEFREQSQEDIWAKLELVNCFRRQFVFSWWFGISVYNPIGVFSRNDPVLNIVSVTPELQPYREEFDDTYKFVGPCVSEEARSVEIKNDDELKNLLGQFDDRARSSGLKLVFMSLGTVFNGNNFIFERAFEAIKNFDQAANRRHLKSSQIKMIVSLGDVCCKEFNEKISRGEYSLPENILLRPRVHQLEVLKRADLFITHCGMNSITEAIKYSVPVIGIPLQGDQPAVAKRACDELQYGVRLDPLNFRSEELADAIDRVVEDEKYKSNISSMSKTMNKYNGAVEGARLIAEHLNLKK